MIQNIRDDINVFLYYFDWDIFPFEFTLFAERGETLYQNFLFSPTTLLSRVWK